MRTLTIVKIGGNVIDDQKSLNQFLSDFSKLKGAKILVHGGGKLACLILSLWLMGSAAWLMWRGGTTVNPRGQPSALIPGGVFAISRNPIYLGDVFVVLAASFWWDAPLGLLVAGGLVWVITDRFIGPEEDRLAETFGDTTAMWFNTTRRWI